MIQPPRTELELLRRAESWSGKTLGQLRHFVYNTYEENEVVHKGVVGQWLEKALGADAHNTSAPDFTFLGIELKTLPVGQKGLPSESTFVTAISLTHIVKETWETSKVYNKLKRVLWVPVEGDATIPFLERRIGQAFLWSPDARQTAVLQADWQEFSDRIILGGLETILAKEGVYLQIRPKAADGRALAWGIDEEGRKIKTLPRGFYLRARFTSELLKSVY